MNESALMVILRLIHILGGIFWVGTVFIITWFLLPANRTTGQAGMVMMQEVMMKRKLSVYLMVAMGLTILSGLAMYGRTIMITHGEWAQTTMAKVLGFGALCGIIGGGLGGSISKATGMKMAAIGKAIQDSGQPPTEAQKAEIAALQAKMENVMKYVVILLILAVAAMASARYL
ncbi:MAG TPA: hypothetical protein VD758_13545 [Gemmatimonadaceae bacterium]|nr:hypothetical protein [Gemmatimonadaceae bacterium]